VEAHLFVKVKFLGVMSANMNDAAGRKPETLKTALNIDKGRFRLLGGEQGQEANGQGEIDAWSMVLTGKHGGYRIYSRGKDLEDNETPRQQEA
jgi:hypothetical protein